MRKSSIHLALLAGATIAAALAVPSAAEAGSWGFTAHGHFRVGGFEFSVGYRHPHRYDPYYRPVTYYRVARPIAYRGYQCGSACYLSRGSYYHHNACPLVLHHFRRHGYFPRGYPGSHYRHDYRHYRHDHRYRDYRRYESPRHPSDRRYDYRYRGGRGYDYRGRYDRDWDSDSDSDSDRYYRRRGAARTRPGYRDY